MDSPGEAQKPSKNLPIDQWMDGFYPSDPGMKTYFSRPESLPELRRFWKSRGQQRFEIFFEISRGIFPEKRGKTQRLFLGMWFMIGFPCFPILDLVRDDWYPLVI